MTYRLYRASDKKGNVYESYTKRLEIDLPHVFLKAEQTIVTFFVISDKFTLGDLMRPSSKLPADYKDNKVRQKLSDRKRPKLPISPI